LHQIGVKQNGQTAGADLACASRFKIRIGTSGISSIFYAECRRLRWQNSRLTVYRCVRENRKSRSHPRPVIVLQYAGTGPFQVVELSAVGGAKKHPDCEEYNQDAERDQKVQGFHVLQFTP
jgi:hypothetical protein